MPDDSDLEIRELGERNGWLTTEICTTDQQQVNEYLANFGYARNTRVWISAYGTVYLYKGKRALSSGEQAHVSLTENVEYSSLSSRGMKEHIAREMDVFRIPGTDDLDIEYYCVRVKEPLEELGLEEDIDF